MVHIMRFMNKISSPVPGRLAVLALASVITIPALAQQDQPTATPQTTSSSDQSASPSTTRPSPSASSSTPAQREGFWGRVYPFARKKWVKKQTDPINDRLTELDGVNAKNASDIKDVDSRAQAGIQKAQSAADAANQTATAAGSQAQNASTTAQGASGHVDQLNTTVKGIDQYHQTTEADVKFRGGSPILSAAAKQQLDDMATSLTGKQGYILEVEGHSPLGGSAGIQSSERLAEAVKRYLVTTHEIPVYRMHAVALGNARSDSDEDSKPVHTSTVHIRLMENSLAAQGASPPHDGASPTGAERQ
jgi:outer membrane protein OmpA-like peptidoglycan-associated protein